MHDSPDQEITDRPTILLGADAIEVDEELAPLVADILTETDIFIVDTYVERRKTGALSGTFVFPSSEFAAAFVSILGSVWEEQQENLMSMTGTTYLEGWGLTPAIFTSEALAEIYTQIHEMQAARGEYDPEDDPDEESDYHDPQTPIDECECGLWHLGIGMAVSIPVGTAGEFARRLRIFLNEEEGRPDIKKEFEGIAGLDDLF